MDATLIDLLNEYVEESNKMANKMLLDFNVASKKDFLEKKSLFLEGKVTIKSINKYIFHGRGCRVTNQQGDVLIDWNFGYDENWVGIDPWLFIQYLQVRKSVEAESYSYDIVKRKCEEMVAEGKMYKKYGLYYFK
ncbi:MAG: hypothetical protein HFG16_03110 [Erysipelotrichaceae bacterium]|nr:hypothetical protein [Erysipelotrichaceae bacterium]